MRISLENQWQLKCLEKYMANWGFSIQSFLDSSFRRLFSNTLIQSHFNYTCTSWIPMLEKRIPKKFQSAYNKCIHFYLNVRFRKSNTDQKCLSYLGPKIWNSLSSDLKFSNSVNSFKHKIKGNFPKIYIKKKRHICVLLNPHVVSRIHDLTLLNNILPKSS